MIKDVNNGSILLSVPLENPIKLLLWNWKSNQIKSRILRFLTSVIQIGLFACLFVVMLLMFPLYLYLVNKYIGTTLLHALF